MLILPINSINAPVFANRTPHTQNLNLSVFAPETLWCNQPTSMVLVMAKCSTTCRCKRIFISLILLCMGTNIPSCFCLDGGRMRCIESERKALLNIEEDIYDPDDWLSSWRKGGDCCNWQGVGCDNATGHVTMLDLQYPYEYDLDDGSGTPPGASKLNPSLLDLMHLKYLDLSMNNFSGAPIPDFIGSLAHLEYLDLSTSGFHGTIPHQLGNLSSLQYLYIDYRIDPSSFSLRVDDLHWLSQLTSLSELQLWAVDLSNAVDWIHDINKLPKLSILVLEYVGLSSIPTTLPLDHNFTSLTKIDLFGNKFNSTIPSWLLNNISGLVDLAIGNCGLHGELPLASGYFSNLQSLALPRNQFGAEIFQHMDSLSHLESLDLAFNVIDGPIPDPLWNLTHLKHIELDENQIPGTLPESLGNHSQLEYFSVSWNRLSGEIPESIGNLQNMTDFYLSGNQISGIIPDTIGNLANLKNFDISSNLIGGEIPHSLFNISLLRQLSLSNNSISGYIPKAIMNLYRLDYLDLSNNGLRGPMFFCNLSSLAYLDLSNNNLYGRLPRFENKSSQLVILNLSNNSLSGHIPNLFGSLPYLGSLHLGSNDLSGKIPNSLKHCQQLVTLELSGNRLSGTIPTWIGESLLSLGILSLRSNQFNGHIPMQLSYLSSLQILDLSQNNLTGNLSLHFKNFSSMILTHFAGEKQFFVYKHNMLYEENLWLITKGFASDYTSVLSAVAIIDLSSNNLSGEIPNELTQLLGLSFLNLSRNHFIGKIPQNISALVHLQALDLSTNDLSGEIPSNMSALYMLSLLNLSNNNLWGEIPSGNQFWSFDDPSIYSGNQGLCGWPLPKCGGGGNAPSNRQPDKNEQKEDEHGDVYETIETISSAAVGFLFGFWAVFGTIMIKQSIRYAYFHSVDKFSHWIYLKFSLNITRLKSILVRTRKQ